ncbi:MAG: DUF4286 family protein [Arenimonas sp.]
MSIIYEVNVFVQREIENDYRAWLEKHVAEILALPGFLDAQVFDVQQDAGKDLAICMQYRLESQTALDNYLEQHAPRLRADGVEKFGNRFTASRRVLLNVRAFASPH